MDVIISARFSEMNQPCVPQKLPLQAARFPQSRYLHGIDFKNPFTMSKRKRRASITAAHAADLLSSSNWMFVRQRTPSVAAKLRLMARYDALAVLAALEVVEPIGIEPMT